MLSASETALERYEQLVQVPVAVRAPENAKDLPVGFLETRERARSLADALLP
jgi:hypothetical protein